MDRTGSTGSRCRMSMSWDHESSITSNQFARSLTRMTSHLRTGPGAGAGSGRRLERHYEKCIRTHPAVDELSWPNLIALSVDVGRMFCIDSLSRDDGRLCIALGAGSGEVRWSGWFIEVESFLARVNPVDWEVVYCHRRIPAGPPRVTSLAFSPSGKWLASSSWDGGVVLFHIELKVAYCTVRLVSPDFRSYGPIASHDSCANQVSWAPDSDYVAVAISRVRKFQGQTHPQMVPGGVALVEVPQAVVDLERYDVDGPVLTPHELETEVCGVWDENGNLPAVWSVALASPPQDMIRLLTPFTEKYVTKTVRLKDVVSTVKAVTTHRGDPTYKRCRMVMAAGCGGASVKLFLATRSSELLQFGSLCGHRSITTNGGVWDVCFLPLDKLMSVHCNSYRLHLASAGEDHQIIIWDVLRQTIASVLPQVSQGFGVTRIRCFIDQKATWHPDVKHVTLAFTRHCNEGTSGRMCDADMVISSNAAERLSRTSDTLAREAKSEGRKCMLLASSWDNSLRLWDIESSSVDSCYSNMHSDAIFDVSLLLSEVVDSVTNSVCSLLRCLTISRDKTVKLWNYEIGSSDHISRIHMNPIIGITVLQHPTQPSRRAVATASKGEKLGGIDLDTKLPLRVAKLRQGRHICSLTPCCASTTAIAYGDSAGEVHVHLPTWTEQDNVELGEVCFTQSHHPYLDEKQAKPALHEVLAVCWVPHLFEPAEGEAETLLGVLLASACSCGRLALWRVGRPKPLFEQPRMASALCSQSFRDVSEKTKGVRMLTGGTDGRITIWDVPGQGEDVTPEELGVLHGHSAAVVVLRLAPDRSQCASGSWDRTVRIWHLPSRTMLRILTSHSHSVTTLMYVPFTQDVISGSLDQKLLAWDVGNTTVTRIFLDHAYPIGALCVTSDGKLLVSGDAGGYVVIKPLGVLTTSLLVVWSSLLRLAESAKVDNVECKTEQQLFSTFVRSPSSVLDCTLFPFRCTLLHYFAMIGDMNALRSCYQNCDNGCIGLKRDCFDRLPIDWAIRRNHMECVDELLYQASQYPWQMGEVLAESLPRICEAVVRTGYRLKYLPVFLDSRLSAPLPMSGVEGWLPLQCQSLAKRITRGSDSTSLSLEECSKFFQVPAHELTAVFSGNRANFRVLYLPNFARIVHDTGISAAAMDHETIQCEAWEALTDFLWESTYRWLYFLWFSSYICYCGLGAFYFVTLKVSDSEHRSSLPSTILLSWNLLFLIGEMLQLRRQGIRIYFWSIWNWIQLFTYFTFTAIITLDFSRQTDSLFYKRFGPFTLNMVAFVGLFCVVNILGYTRGVVGMAIVMRMLYALSFSLRYLAFILCIVLLAFFCAFWMLLNIGDQHVPMFRRLADQSTCETPVSSGFDLVVLLLRGGVLLDSVIDSLRGARETGAPEVEEGLWVLYIVFTFLVTIVMLNLLIAVMTSEYKAIEKVSKIEVKRERFAIVRDLQSAKSTRLIFYLVNWLFGTDLPYFPRYLVLYTALAEEADSKGRAIDRELKARAAVLEESSLDNMGLDRDVDMRIARLVGSHFEALECRLSALQDRVKILDSNLGFKKKRATLAM